MDDKTNEIINAILRRGNDVQIQRKGNGYVILEVTRIIRAVNGMEQAFEKDLSE